MTSSLVRAGDTAPAVLPRIERARRRLDLRRLRRLRRPALIAAAVAVGLWLVVQLNDRLVSAVIYEHRQERLSADYRQPAPNREIRNGDPLAVIQAPTIGLDQIVVAGDSVDALRGGPAWRSSTALPGEPGRTVVLGHGATYGSPFGRIDRLAPGATIAVQTRNGGPIVAYVVRQVLTDASPDDVPPADPELAELVLVSSLGGFFDVDHVVVVASTLPVIDSPPRVGELTLDASDRGVPFGVDALVANVAAATAALVWFGIRGRHRRGLALAVVTPVALVATVAYLHVLDTLLPSVR